MNFEVCDYKIISNDKSAEYSMEKNTVDDITYLKITLTQNEVKIPEQFAVEWIHSGVGCCANWSPDTRVHDICPSWGGDDLHSRLASQMPVEQCLSFDGRNRICVALSDCDTPSSLKMGYIEESANIICRVKIFTVPTHPIEKYTVTLRIDQRDIPFYDSIYDTAAWWENECGYESAYVPDSAKKPMDSLWYSFHQQLYAKEIIEQCKQSVKAGLETVILDDGWQTDDNSRGYAYCGDWQVCKSKIPDMKELVKEIHALGMKVMLWYSVPFVGMYSEKYEEFKGYLLDDCGNAGTAFALDPRYKKVRDYLVSIYENAVRNWNLDGLKLDFIDSFKLKRKSLEPDSKRDFQSLELALHALMGEIKERLTALNPEILIEFRQSYVGPAIRKYGNMLRVGDCPGDIVTNRSQIINLRFTSGKTAVHSDMLMWHKCDSVENAALQYANIIFGVPQVSLKFSKIPENHIKMIKYYTEFWKNNREVLIEGKLTAEHPENDYSKATSTLGNKSVIALYTDSFADVKTDECIIVNAGAGEKAVIKHPKNVRYKIVNCLGEALFEGTADGVLTEFNIPKAGMVYIKGA